MAQSGQPAQEKVLVAAAPCPPFVIVEEGQLSGLAVYLWDQVAQQIGIEYDLVEIPLGKLLGAISEDRPVRRAAVGISCLSITAEREKVIDFSHSFYETYTGIAVREQGVMDVLAGFFANPSVWRALGIVLAIAAVVGGIFFALEGRINSRVYATTGPVARLFEALVVGLLFVTRGPLKYYDFQTTTARFLSAFLAIGGTFLIAGVTALLASAFTVESLRSQVSGLDDLKKFRVAALEASTSSSFLRANGIPHQTREDLDTMMNDLEQRRLDAIVADEAFLKYAINKGKEQGLYTDLSVLPYEFDTQNYGFALEQDSKLDESVNRALLIARKSPEWRSKLQEYIGK
jgi:polar amino acid transport system substrate-binding protein